MPKQYADIIWNPDRHRECAEQPRREGASVTHVFVDYETPAAKRGIDMLLSKFHGAAFKSEVPITAAQSIPMPRLMGRLEDTEIAFVTDGGLVPRGNPDNLVPVGADRFCTYSLQGQDRLCAGVYEVSHQGYDNTFVLEDPNRLLPLDAARRAEAAGRISRIADRFYSTAGVMISIENSREFGRKIAASAREQGIGGVIVSSTCGTSTRCGAYIACEIERAGIPVVHVTNLTQISEGVGCSRILQGNHVAHVFGNPDLLPEQEMEYRDRLFEKALALLATVPDENSCIVMR